MENERFLIVFERSTNENTEWFNANLSKYSSRFIVLLNVSINRVGTDKWPTTSYQLHPNGNTDCYAFCPKLIKYTLVSILMVKKQL